MTGTEADGLDIRGRMIPTLTDEMATFADEMEHLFDEVDTYGTKRFRSSGGADRAMAIKFFAYALS